MVKLISRFYDATGGTVRIDGTDVRRLDLAGYRHRLGVVPQDAFLFPGTVRDAIAYGRPEASDAEVEAAARAVGAHEMIARLSDGYQHEVAERGRNLSNGQRQLLALARAELVDPDILLMDEATAALDLETEAAVTRAADRLARRRTTIVVAHRLTTAARADRIAVIDGGRLVELGSHAELLAADGLYARQWRVFTADGADPLGHSKAGIRTRRSGLAADELGRPGRSRRRRSRSWPPPGDARSSRNRPSTWAADSIRAAWPARRRRAERGPELGRELGEPCARRRPPPARPRAAVSQGSQPVGVRWRGRPRSSFASSAVQEVDLVAVADQTAVRVPTRASAVDAVEVASARADSRSPGHRSNGRQPTGNRAPVCDGGERVVHAEAAPRRPRRSGRRGRPGCIFAAPSKVRPV